MSSLQEKCWNVENVLSVFGCWLLRLPSVVGPLPRFPGHPSIITASSTDTIQHRYVCTWVTLLYTSRHISCCHLNHIVALGRNWARSFMILHGILMFEMNPSSGWWPLQTFTSWLHMKRVDEGTLRCKLSVARQIFVTVGSFASWKMNPLYNGDRKWSTKAS